VSFESFEGDRQVGPTEPEPEVVPAVVELRPWQQQHPLGFDQPGRPGIVRRGKPTEPARGRTQVNRSLHASKNVSRATRLSATIERERARTVSRARSPIRASTSDGADEQIVV
jgi:hypothetical protein